MKEIFEIIEHAGDGTFIPKDQMIVTVKDDQIILYPPKDREEMSIVEEAVGGMIHKLVTDTSFAAEAIKWLRLKMAKIKEPN